MFDILGVAHTDFCLAEAEQKQVVPTEKLPDGKQFC